MNNKNTENVQEQYENALVALIMDEYTEAEGAILLKEFKEADEKGEVPDVPADLDAACRKKIHSHFAKQRSEETFRRVVKMFARSAAMLFATLGVASVLIFSVEAFRTPVINFFLEQHEHYSVIGHGSSDEPQQGTNEHLGNDDAPLAGLLPSGYVQVKFQEKNNGAFMDYYKNESGETIVLQTDCGNTLIGYDTENAEMKPAKIRGYEALIIWKHGIKLIWHIPETDMTYQLKASDLQEDEIWQLAIKIIERGI